MRTFGFAVVASLGLLATSSLPSAACCGYAPPRPRPIVYVHNTFVKNVFVRNIFVHKVVNIGPVYNIYHTHHCCTCSYSCGYHEEYYNDPDSYTYTGHWW